MKEILESFSKVTDLANEIASASREQAEGVDQISSALGQIDGVTQANTANAEESAAAAEELSGQSSQLNEMLRQFTLSRSLAAADETRIVRAKMKGSNGKNQGAKTSHSEDHIPLNGSDTKIIKPNEVIQLDDAQFEGF